MRFLFCFSSLSRIRYERIMGIYRQSNFYIYIEYIQIVVEIPICLQFALYQNIVRFGWVHEKRRGGVKGGDKPMPAYSGRTGSIGVIAFPTS